LAVRAFAAFSARYPDARFTVVGDGPDRGHLQKLARRLGIDSKVSFDGECPYDETQEIYASHDVLLFPSFHDSGGLVVLEAMNSGLPVICLDLGGPAMAVRNGVGITIRAGSPRQVAHDLAEALARLAADPELRTRMGEFARSSAANVYSWEHRGEEIRELYATAVSPVSRLGVAEARRTS
jgi:glycosyltransferase involved in cell wall biosynthesis